MEIIEYDSKYKQDFIDFNTAWIVDNFGFLEPEDKETFDKIDEELSKGSMIYFAIEDGVALATCMHREHKGCGSAVFEAAMQWAANHRAKKLFLISNSHLKPAIHIYEKYGFKEIKLDNYGYVRGDIAFEKIIAK